MSKFRCEVITNGYSLPKGTVLIVESNASSPDPGQVEKAARAAGYSPTGNICDSIANKDIWKVTKL